MGNLGVSFIFGPVGGGETAPFFLRTGYGLTGWILDLVRDVSNAFVRIDPTLRAVWQQAIRIYVRTPATARFIPARLQHKVHCQIELGIDEGMAQARGAEEQDSSLSTGLRVLYAGRFLCWKGMHLGLPAFAVLVKKYPQATLTMVGQGREEKLWRRLADKLGIAQHVTWVPWVPRERLAALYLEHDAFLFPSLHDSGGYVVLEALAHGLPVICVDLGGPPLMVDETCGCVIPVSNSDKATVIKGLADALITMATNPDLRSRLSAGAIDRAGQFRWSDTVHRVYAEIEVSLERRCPVD
jgi:glycosyltransferase involved in cell wall biosynthesis